MTEKNKILIVDDERINRKILSDLLQTDHKVIVAKDGEQALNRVKNTPELDLILLDVMMPKMDGYEVLQNIKEIEHAKEIPVIFITALSSSGDEERGLIIGAVDYITKPFRPAIVKVRVETHLRLVRQRKMLEHLAGKDGLTNINNRRCFDKLLDQEWHRKIRDRKPLSLAMIDVDFFKPYNDNYGHALGDRVLKSVADALESSLQRSSDSVARYGGEEFVLLLPNTDEVGAMIVAENARIAVEKLCIPHEFSHAASHITVSIGGATFLTKEFTNPLELVKSADTMLYQAKEQGRNRIIWTIKPI